MIDELGAVFFAISASLMLVYVCLAYFGDEPPYP